jgi:hypothetical protein
MSLPASSGLNAAPANFQIVSRWNRMVRIQRGVWIANGSAEGRLKPREGRHRADHPVSKAAALGVVSRAKGPGVVDAAVLQDGLM